MGLIELARRLRVFIEKASASLSDEDALDATELFPHWKENGEYAVGNRVSYEGVLYKCLTAHTAQASWMPNVSPSLWVRVDNPAEEWPEWVQPMGSTDAYPMGAKVSYNEKHWTSIVDSNVWAPGTHGWDEVVD